MDCQTCQKHLAEVLRAERPRRLLEAIQQWVVSAQLKAASKVQRREPVHAPPLLGTSGLSGKAKGGGDSEDEGTEPVLEPGGLRLVCQTCPREGPAAAARAYLEAPPPGVVLCANRLGSRREVEEAVVHELVHAYDYLVAGVELLDCQSLAYSEVRAARAAECSKTSRSLVCSYFRKNCVRSTAVRSTEGLFPGKGAGCVDAVFNAAYQDQRPHDDDCR